MEFLEVPFFDDDIYKMAVRFLFNMFFMVMLLRYCIRPNQRDREFAFTVVMMNVTVFFICFALKKLELGLGMAIGLFAIFGVLRYRTDAIRTKEMTYLFIVIGIAVINSLSNRKTSYMELLLVNFLILGIAMLKESILFKATQRTESANSEKTTKVKKQRKFSIRYDKIEWLGSENKQAVLADLKERTNIDVQRFRVQDIDLQNNFATLLVWDDAPPLDQETTPSSDP